jgi:uncharacterized protein (DUF736 family)
MTSLTLNSRAELSPGIASSDKRRTHRLTSSSRDVGDAWGQLAGTKLKACTPF